jgi:hypothetical protein
MKIVRTADDARGRPPYRREKLNDEREVTMKDSSDRTLDRLGAAAGIAAVVLLVSLFTVLPALPSPNKPISEIAHSATANRSGLLAAAYLGALLSGALLLFGAVLAARLRRAEGSAGGWWVIALSGIAGSAFGIVGNVFSVVFVRAVEHGASGNELWVGYGADHWAGVLVGIPLAVFIAGAVLGARATRVVSRWLVFLGGAVAPLLAVGAGSVIGNEVDGGALGSVLLLGYVGLIVWIVGVSVSLWRGSGQAAPVPNPIAEPSRV